MKAVGTDMIVPIMKSNPQSVGRMREQADDCFLSASKKGPYRIAEVAAVEPNKVGRKLTIKKG